MTLNSVFVLDTTKKPLTPCSSARARILLRDSKAAVWRAVPFTIILKVAKPDAAPHPLTVKIDPGSKTTGLALVDCENQVVFAAELTHRGPAIKSALDTHHMLRRGRRGRKTRYREARFNNRTRPQGWLPPSLQHRVDTTFTWVNRFRRWAPVATLAVERVKFDMQQMNNPDISSVEYQQGTLAGYSAQEYLLEKWHRKCAYCGIEHVSLQIEHIKARANGGTNNISNLTLACGPCNRRKGTQDLSVFLKNKPEVHKRVLAQLKRERVTMLFAESLPASKSLQRISSLSGVPIAPAPLVADGLAQAESPQSAGASSLVATLTANSCLIVDGLKGQCDQASRSRLVQQWAAIQ